MYNSFTDTQAGFKDLIGKTLSSVDIKEPDPDGPDDPEGRSADRNDLIILTSTCGNQYILCHYQDCCEHVYVEDVCGDIKDLIGSPIIEAEEVSHENETPGDLVTETTPGDYRYTWTFYKLGTIKGCVTIRFLGQSNGYYSESVDFIEVTREQQNETATNGN